MPHFLYNTGVFFLLSISASVASLSLMVCAICAVKRIQKLHASHRRVIVELSHNLQTPLAVLRGKIERLEQGVLRDGDMAGLKNSVDSVARFVSDHLAFTYLEERLEKEAKDLFSLSALVQEVCEELVELAENKQIFLKQNIAPHVYLLGCENYMRDVVMNLVCNAIKYMGSGSIRRIHVSLNKMGGKISLIVTDTGMGIPKNELPRVFERFYRGSNKIYGSVSGTGLGLAIAKRIVKEHGGIITVTSEIGKGSTFTIILPTALQGYLRSRLR